MSLIKHIFIADPAKRDSWWQTSCPRTPKIKKLAFRARLNPGVLEYLLAGNWFSLTLNDMDAGFNLIYFTSPAAFGQFTPAPIGENF